MKLNHSQYLILKQLVEDYENEGRNGKNHIQLRDCNLSFRVVERLYQNNFNTIGDVRNFFKSKGVYGFFQLRGFGKCSVEEVRILLDMTHEDFYKS